MGGRHHPETAIAFFVVFLIEGPGLVQLQILVPVLNQAPGQDPPHPNFQGGISHPVHFIVLVTKASGPRPDHFSHGQQGPPVDVLPVQLGFNGPNGIFQPGLQF